VEYFNFVGSIVTYDARCARGIEPRMVLAKEAFSKKKTLFTFKLNLNVGKKLANCYIWSTALCGAEIWTLRNVDQKYLESPEMWYWRRMGKISWTDRVKAEKYYIQSRIKRTSYIK